MMTLRDVAFAIGALTTATALLVIVGKLVFLEAPPPSEDGRKS